MSSARVESPLLFRRQPSPPVSRMPKPSACRKLFAVDRDATDGLWKEELAKMKDESKEFGFDFIRGEPLPDPDGSSRYTDWEAVPNERVPSFYHETVAGGKPCRPSSRPVPASFTSSSQAQSPNNGHNNPAPLCCTGRNAVPPAPTTILTTGSSRSFVSAQRQDLQPASANQSSTIGSSPNRPKEIPSALIEHVTEECASNPKTSRKQCQITDFMRQRKRTGSDSSSSTSSVSSADTNGEKLAQAPAKRRRQGSGSPVASSVASSSPTTGMS